MSPAALNGASAWFRMGWGGEGRGGAVLDWLGVTKPGLDPDSSVSAGHMKALRGL